MRKVGQRGRHAHDPYLLTGYSTSNKNLATSISSVHPRYASPRKCSSSITTQPRVRSNSSGFSMSLRYFGRSCSGTLPKAPSNHRFGVLFLDDQAKLVKIALAEATMNTPRALDLMGFGIESQEPIFFRASMQCTMKNADFTAFRKRIMEAVELCHHRASCGARTAPSPASIPRV